MRKWHPGVTGFRTLCAFLTTLAASPAFCVASGSTPPATPSPAPAVAASPSPTPADPCGGDTRLLATLNRPTIGYSPCSVAAGTAVFEEGYQNQQQGRDLSTIAIQYPQSFTRIGVKPRVELDAIGPYYNTQMTPDGTGGYVRTHGYQDSGLGFKYQLPPTGRFVVAFDGLYTAPNGSPNFTLGGPTYTGNIDVGYSITPTWGVGTTLAFQSTSGFDAAGKQSRYAAFMPSIAMTTQLGNQFQLYAEYVYLNKIAPDGAGRGTLDYGVQHLLGKRFEIDVEQGVSITPDRNLRFQYVGVGFGWQVR